MESELGKQTKLGLGLLAVLAGFSLVPVVAYCLYAWRVIPHFHQPVYDIHTLGVLATAWALILWERRRLAQFHIDGLVLGLLVFGPVIQWLVGLSFRGLGVVEEAYLNPWWPKLALDAVLLALLFAFKVKIPKPSPMAWWFAGGAAALVVLALVSGLAYPHAGPKFTEFGATAMMFVVGLTRPAAYEELLFRAFLWGYLRLLGWSDLKILIVQAALYLVFYIYLLPGSLFGFFIVTPVAALILGYLAWKGRSIAPSMVANALTMLYRGL